MTYSIYITGHANNASKEETAEEARKLVDALDGVSSAELKWSDGADQAVIDLRQPAESADAGGDTPST